MATVAIVCQNTSSDQARIIGLCIEELGHTATEVLDSPVTDANLASYGLIVVIDPQDSLWATLAGYFEDYMTDDTIPFLFFQTTDGLSDEGVSNLPPECVLGLVAQTRAATTEAGNTAGKVDLHEDHQDTIVGAGFPVEQDFRWAEADGNVSSAAGKATVAGSKLLERVETGECMGSLAESGDARVAAKYGTTFPVRVGWLGIDTEGGLAWEMAPLVQTMVKWALGDYASSTTYSTTLTSAIRFPSIDISGAGTYSDSLIDWTEDKPTNTAIVVETSRDGETWSTATKAAAIPGFTPSESLTGERLWVKVTLSTTDGVDTPVFSDLELKIEGEGVDLTATDGYFDGGPLKWLTGNNAGRSMEVKEYDHATKTVTLFIVMPNDIQVGDTSEISAGCDKTIATCNTKFSNSANFQGEPNVPGEDQVQLIPDRKG